MKADDYLAILPLVIQAGSVLVLLLTVCIRRHHGATAILSVLGSAAALATLPLTVDRVPHEAWGLLVIDRFALFYLGLIFSGSLAVAVLAYGYFGRHGIRKEEFYILLQSATTGAAVLVSTTHFAAVFLGLELLSVSLYGMIAYLFNRRYSLEAAVKYLILAAAASAFLLMGMALIYAESGHMTFTGLVESVTGDVMRPQFILGGVAMIMTGIGFKLALVPFHMWVSDIYQGAPVPVAAFMATVSKGAVVSLLLRFALLGETAGGDSLQSALMVLAIASMLGGNFLALMQTNICRLLAYSSIAHAGYVLVAVLAGGTFGVEAVTFYVTIYFVTVLGAFGSVSVLSPGRRDFNELDDFRGLFWRRPVVAAVFTGMLLSLAGLPLTGGFVGKFLLLSAAVGESLWVLVLVLVAGSGVGLYYYLRVVGAMFGGYPENLKAPPTPLAGGVLLVMLGAAILVLGVYPEPMLGLIRSLILSVP